MLSWHGWDNTPGADIVWRPPSNRRTPFRDRGGDLHKASGFQRASRTIWHRVRKKTETNGRTKLLLRLVSQNSNSPLGLYDILWTGKRPKHEQTSIILKPKKLENKKDWFYPSNKGTIIDGLILQFELNWKKAYGAKKEKLDASPKRRNFPATIQCFQTTLNFTKQESKCCWYLVLSVKCFNCFFCF